MISLNINGREINGYKGQTILEVARENGIEIPTLCHDDRIKTYGACGLCVVEIEDSSRLLRSCSTEIAPGMIINTESMRVQSSRKVTLELLLSDHSGDCRPPCVNACPAHTDCQGYVGLIANGEYHEALKLIKEQLPIPASIGMVCPHPCEEVCRRQMVEEPIAIAALKVFAAEQDLKSASIFIPEIKEASGKKVAIIGSGPAGLTAAYFLARAGHGVTVYEAMPEAGGMLRYGIPEYRLPKVILDQEINVIHAMGVEFIYNTKINVDVSLDYIRKHNDAVFVGIGAWKYSRIGCSGEDVSGVIGGIDFLREAALNGKIEIGNRVAVVGGGNTAMDAARTAVRLGAKQVMVLYRRTRAEMPAEDIEIREAEEEGVEFKFLLAPEEIIADGGKVSSIRMQKMQLGEPDASGRRSPVPIEGEQELIPVDTIIAAIGQQVDMSDFGEIGASKWRTIAIDENSFMTNLPGVFAGGDAVTGPGIAIGAVGQGRRAADVMISYLQGDLLPYKQSYIVERKDLTKEDFVELKKEDRVKISHMEPQERKDNFREIAGRMSNEDAEREASRCLECGCRDYFECKLIKYSNHYQVEPQYLQGEKHQAIMVDDHPFIERDSAKCILCGLCVRICDELMGVNALGLVHRGFDTVVKPEFGMALRDTACIACGQCVAVCPTGALLERYPQVKNVPVHVRENTTVCSFCGMGCGQIVNSCGESVMRMLPQEKEILCSRGRFAFGSFTKNRLTSPLIRKNGELVESSWEEAMMHISKKTLSLRSRFGNTASAVFAAPFLTLEEAGRAASFGKIILGTSKLSSFTNNSGRGLSKVFGENLSTNTLDEVDATDLILMLGSFNENQVMAVRARNAVKRGAKLVIISQESSLVDDLATIRLSPDNNTGIIKEILAAVINQGKINRDYIDNRTVDYEVLQDYLRGTIPGDQALEIAALYTGVKKAMILVDGYKVSAVGVELLADLAVITERVGSSRNGIIVVTPGGNGTGVWHAGFTNNYSDVISSIEMGETKIAFILGEDPIGGGAVKPEVLAGLEFLVVLSPFMTAAAAMADIVLPASTPLEVTGTYISADGKLAVLQKVKSAPAGRDNIDILGSLISAMNPAIRDVDNEIDKLKLDKVWRKAIKFETSFAFEDGKARLSVPDDSLLFETVAITDPALLRYNEKLHINLLR